MATKKTNLSQVQGAAKRAAKPFKGGPAKGERPGDVDLSAWGISRPGKKAAPAAVDQEVPDFSGVQVEANVNALDLLRTMATVLRDKTAGVQRKQEALDEAVTDLARYQMVNIPQAMELAGVKKFELEDGSELSLKDGLNATIKEANRHDAHGWLVAKGHGAIIKIDYIIDVRSLTDKKREALLKKIAASGVAAQSKESVHPQTLKSLVKEMLEKGITLPPSISVFQFKKAELKEPKAK